MPSRDHKFLCLHICCRRHHTRFAYRVGIAAAGIKAAGTQRLLIKGITRRHSHHVPVYDLLKLVGLYIKHMVWEGKLHVNFTLGDESSGE